MKRKSNSNDNKKIQEKSGNCIHEVQFDKRMKQRHKDMTIVHQLTATNIFIATPVNKDI